ncbi:protein BCL9 homolog [Drosophila obscura]|uniref:protein BCL9 homolog n=1 Tax=Drosophila obscura TaxID=7282 RepID=UPI001BB0F924|nr:protein BCL9 homolog [Drosophila obscura]XP_022217426.2 protein BCL9 homolog [Drosophila obscura]
MLSTTMPLSPAQAQTQANVDASTSASSVGIGIGIGIGCASGNSPKSEPFATLSPDQTKAMSDDASENNGVPKSGKDGIGTSGNGSGGGNGNSGTANADGQQSSSAVGAVSTPMLRQNSSSSINSCLVASPNNTSEHSNSSNVSAVAALAQMGDSDLVQQQDEHSKKKKTIVKDEDAEKASNKAKCLGSGAGSGSGSLSAASVAIKEEPADVLTSLVNVKKEENHSPNMSPVGFGSIGGPSGNAQESAVATVKMELNVGSSSSEKTTSALSTDELGGMGGVGCNQLSSDLMNETSNTTPGSSGVALNISAPHANATSGGPGCGVGVGMGNLMTGNGGTSIGVGVGNCLDYMQQQNHIFVFSTQLANKGAESVLSGQFQTIIAYHCTQPATKSFLEDFFMKNPMKMNKLQRQSSLGMPWMGIVPGITATGPNLVSKLSQQSTPQSKSSGSLQKSQPQFNQADNSKRNSMNAPGSTFADQPDNLNENDLMCWETGVGAVAGGTGSGSGSNARNNIESCNGPNESQAIKLLEAAGVDLGQGKSNDLNLSHENNIISLQGVKVPDENLTPQQRQHREEQLAKIKKMNQFLFPENDNGSGANQIMGNQLSKLPTDMMMSIPGGGSAGAGSPIVNPQMRHMHLPGNMKPEHITGSGLSEDVLLAGDAMSEMGTAMCNSGQKNSLQCGPAPGATPVTGAGSINVNMQCPNSGAPNGNLIANSSDLLGNQFGNPNCGIGIIGNGPDMSKGMPNQLQDGLSQAPQAGMAQMEWSKIQQQFFEERLKGGKARPGAGPSGPPVAQPHQQSAGSNQVRNSLQGPPPPYHSTQRSASVPIATQSPNPSSPNNLSLPSPRTTGAALGLPANSPSMDGPGSVPVSTTAAAAVAAAAVATSQANTMAVHSGSKNCFQTDAASPSNQNSNPNRNRSSGTSGVLNHHLNSNPSTPLSHLSPKELESFNQPNSNSGDNMKNRRPSPHRPRSPGNCLIEANMETRFAASSPGVNFNPHPHMQSNTNTALNAYKVSSSNIAMERQNSGPGGQVQFNRRSDNIPLNPNSGNRPPPNKMAQNFDPISSLAQMSQQLTSCVSSMGSPAGAGGMNMMGGAGPGSGPVDMNIEHGIGMMSGIDPTGMDAMNAQNSCHPMNPLMNPMGQRMLNPKMCIPGAPPGFNPNSPNGVIREGLGPGPGTGPIPSQGNAPNFHGILPPGARLMGRMPVNFGSNFNPNIQVKASTPNTIQYMPVRPQNANNNNNNGVGNIRMPPSLEFLQRYANPQLSAGGNGPPTICPPLGSDGGMMVGPGAGPMLMNTSSEQQQLQQQNKMANNPGNPGNGMGFFQNCNQLSVMDDEGTLAGHDMGMGIGQQSMIRGMRPHGMRQHGMGPRLQAPVGNLINRQQIQFAHTPDGQLDCGGDPTAIFNNAPCNSSGPGPGPGMFSASQQSNQTKPQHLKSMPSGMCQNPTGVGVGPAAGQGQIQAQMQGQSVIGPSNNNIMSAAGNSTANGATSVNFVGPSSNDLKYAQQYHSFQQQLYATNTRSQQQQQMQQQQGNMIAMPPNLSPNPAFFVNK